MCACLTINAQQVDIDNSTGTEPVAIKTLGQAYENAIKQDIGTESWRTTVWTDNSYKIIKLSGATFTPLSLSSTSFNNAIIAGSSGVGIGTARATHRLR